MPIALVYAKEKGYDEVIFSLVYEDCKYESNKPKIIEELERLAELLGVKLTILFLNLSKSLVSKMGIDPSLTYSCVLDHKSIVDFVANVR